MAAQLMRATLRAFDPVTWLAAVEPLAGPAALLSDLPVLNAVRPEELLAGREVAVLLWPDVGGVVLGPVVAPAGHKLVWGLGCQGPAGDTTLGTSSQDIVSHSESDLPAGQLLLVASLAYQCTAYSAAQNVTANLLVDSSQVHGAYTTIMGNWYADTIALLAVATLAAGAHTWKLVASKASSANTVLARASSRLLWAHLL